MIFWKMFILVETNEYMFKELVESYPNQQLVTDYLQSPSKQEEQKELLEKY